MAQEVVILGEDGAEHVFPEGFDPKRAAAIVRTESSAVSASRRVPAAGRGTQLDVRKSEERSTNALPAVGGAIGGALFGIPGAAAGGAIGTGVKAGIQRRVPGVGELAGSAAINAATEGAGQYVVAPALTATGRFIEGRALPFVKSAVKPTLAVLRREAGQQGTGVTAQANRFGRLLLKNRWTNPEQAAAAIKATEERLQTELANAGDITLDTAQRVPRYLGQVARSASQQLMPRADQAAIEAAGREVLHGPLARDVTTTTLRPSPSGLVTPTGQPVMVPVPQTSRVMRTDVTPAEGLQIARTTGKWGNRKAWGEMKGAEQEASKAGERAVRDAVKTAVPTAAPILQQQGQALKLFPILDRMAHREGNRDAMSLPGWVMAAHGGVTGGIGGAVANALRNSQLKAGYAAADLGPALIRSAGRTGQVTGDALRAALLALMTGDATDETGQSMPPSGVPPQEISRR
jgi:hypothetical protein